MPAIRQNKLIPVMALVALLVVGFVFWTIGRDGEKTTPAGKPLVVVPGVEEPVSEESSGFLSAAKNVHTTTKADTDTPTETIRTLTSEVAAMRNEMQQVTGENRQLRSQAAQAQFTKDQLKTEIKAELQASTPAPASAPASPAPAAASGSESIFEKNTSLLGQLPSGFGFDKVTGGSLSAADARSGPTTPASQTILPLGVRVNKGANGQDTLMRTSFAGTPGIAGGRAPGGTVPGSSLADPANSLGPAGGAKGARAAKKDVPFYTIPENATLMGATAMTAIVGRIPINGRVEDPMQFKLLLGPDNLAANGHVLPRDLSGIVASGVAIGDLNLSCSKGIIQSLTFVFNDGSIRTVSMRSNGTTPGVGGSGGQGSQQGLIQTAKLGYISDRYGNPCITGELKTNAPEYLGVMTALKTLSLAGKAAAMAQTTSSSSVGYGGSSSTSSVTGDKGSYVLGEAISGATDEVTNWVTQRMSNSFDAIVTMAGADVVVHIDQPIAIDKTTDARLLDYGQDDLATSRTLAKGTRHGLD